MYSSFTENKQMAAREADTLLENSDSACSRKRRGCTVLMVVAVVVALVIGVVIGFLLPRAESEPLDLMQTPAERFDLFEKLKAASKSTAPALTVEDFEVDPSDYRKYKTGQHRRPTDPASAQEVRAALELLFGRTGEILTLQEADTIAENVSGWGKLNPSLTPRFRIFPETVRQSNALENTTYTPSQAQTLFLEQLVLLEGDIDATHRWLRNGDNEELRASVRWHSIVATTTHVVDKFGAIDVDADIDAGFETTFRRHVAVKIRGGITGFDAVSGELEGAEVLVDVDVTDVTTPFVDELFTETYNEYRGNINTPSHAPAHEMDLVYTIAAAMALYGNDAAGSRRTYLPVCNGAPENAECRVDTWGGSVKFFVRPFFWLEGENATLYGGTRNETVMSLMLSEYSPSIHAFDGQQVSAGTYLGSPPLTLVYAAEERRKDPFNTLVASQAIALCWYGRGLTFPVEQAEQLFDAIDRVGDTTDFPTIARILSEAIHEAWGEEALVGGEQPGILDARPSDGVLVPAIVLKHPRTIPMYVNHATPSPVEDALGTTRDVRNNPSYARPLPRSPDNDESVIPPAGKHLDSIAVNGPSFEMNGYAVKWDVGLTWRFSIGFDADAGITLYNVRLQLPPTVAFPKGEIVPYLWRLNIPNFGTTYANSDLGNTYSAAFLESHFNVITDLVPGANCRGPHRTLPLFVAQSSSRVESQRFSYSTYGVPGFTDPFAEILFGEDLPFNAFPLERSFSSSGALDHGICIQEVDEGHAMWHTYTAQRLRSLQVFGTTLSEAYNVVNSFDLLSDGKIRVVERLHGKPAQMGHGAPGAGGAYASDGKGGFAANHLHWHVVAMEPHVKRNIAEVVNHIEVVDMIPPSQHKSDIYGTAQLWESRRIFNSSLSAANNDYSFEHQRGWVMGATREGVSLGGLKVTSKAWGPPLSQPGTPPGLYNLTSLLHSDSVLQQWWLQHDVFMSSSDWTRAKHLLLSPSKTKECRRPMGSTRRCVDDVALGDSPVLYAVMRKYHHVITDELPVQNGFSMVELEIAPHNLFTYNPNMLARYMPEYSNRFQNPISPPLHVYTPPYETEWEL